MVLLYFVTIKMFWCYDALLGLVHEECIAKMRLLSLVDLSSDGSGQIPYELIRDTLQVNLFLVSMFVYSIFILICYWYKIFNCFVMINFYCKFNWSLFVTSLFLIMFFLFTTFYLRGSNSILLKLISWYWYVFSI